MFPDLFSNNIQITKSKLAGFTLLELLVTILISIVVIAGLSQGVSQAIIMSKNLSNQQNANVSTYTLLSQISREFAFIGAGVPFAQANFAVDSPNLADTTLAEAIVLASSDDQQITYRLNTTNKVYQLTASFDPSSTLTISLGDTTGIYVGDEVYISNYQLGEDDGFYGVVDDVNASSIEIDSADYDYSTGATFDAGSVLEVVTMVTLESRNNGNIYRNEGYGDVLLASDASFVLTYYDENGNVLSSPPSVSNLKNNLSSLLITLTVNGGKQYDGKGGSEDYSNAVSRRYALRNLIYAR